MVLEEARPWGRGRSEFAKKSAPRMHQQMKSFIWLPTNSGNRSGSWSENSICGFRIAQVVRAVWPQGRRLSLASWKNGSDGSGFRFRFGSCAFLALEIVLAHRNRNDFCDLRLRCPSRTPEIARFPKQETAMMHCDLRVRWKVASDLRFRAAISEPETPDFSFREFCF